MDLEQSDKSTNDPEEIKKNNWPDPTPEMMNSDEFNAIWELIQTWGILSPSITGEKMVGATGNHVRAIIDAINKSRPDTIKSMVQKLKYSDLGGSTRMAIVDKLSQAVSNTIT